MNGRSTHNEVIYLRNSVAQLIKDFTSAENFRDLNELMNKAHDRAKKVQETLNEIENSNRIPNDMKLFTFDRPDLALINSGGRVAGIGKETKLFYSCNFFFKLLGCPNKQNSPERALEPSMHPGDCFGFYGDKATLYIRLIGAAIVDSVTIEHIPKQMSPTGDVSDAPRKFSVYVSFSCNLCEFLFFILLHTKLLLGWEKEVLEEEKCDKEAIEFGSRSKDFPRDSQTRSFNKIYFSLIFCFARRHLMRYQKRLQR